MRLPDVAAPRSPAHAGHRHGDGRVRAFRPVRVAESRRRRSNRLSPDRPPPTDKIVGAWPAKSRLSQTGQASATALAPGDSMAWPPGTLPASVLALVSRLNRRDEAATAFFGQLVSNPVQIRYEQRRLSVLRSCL